MYDALESDESRNLIRSEVYGDRELRDALLSPRKNHKAEQSLHMRRASQDSSTTSSDDIDPEKALPSTNEPPTEASTSRWSRWIEKSYTVARQNYGVILLFALLFLEPVLVVFGLVGASQNVLEQFEKFIRGSDAVSGMVMFTAAYAALVILAVPSSPITFAAGFLFGSVKGVCLSMVGSCIAAACSLVAARFFGAQNRIWSWVEHWLSPARVHAFDSAITRDAFRFVFFVRLSPAFPFGLSNYVFAVSSVPFLPYVIASMLGILPGTILLAASGSLADNLVLNRANVMNSELLTVVGIVASILVFVIVTRAVSKSLTEDLEDLEAVESEDSI
mmetsp:Transcript_5577/g.9803  ORF Transcript_5577/g.9803 Transcript_5577/m.9803 type:complete len:333 (-) Transcript_5577:1072-2070(-)